MHTDDEWTSIKSWNTSDLGHSGVIIDEYYYVARGTYRVCSTASIYNSRGNLLEMASFYSAERTY